MKKQTKADLALLGITVIWGSTFVMIKNTIAFLPTFNFLALRFLSATLFTSIVFFKYLLKITPRTLLYGSIIGSIGFVGYALQTLGLHHTTASKSGFISGFAVIIVPIFSAWLLKERPNREAIVGVALAMLGLGFLTLTSGFALNMGDLITLISALMFAMHIITVGRYSSRVNPISMALVQMAVLGIWSLVFSLAVETPGLPTEKAAWFSIGYLAVFATSGAFIIQNAMQRFTSPTHAALIFTGEPVFSAIFAHFLLGERLGLSGAIGSLLILSGMLISELNWKQLFLRPSSKKEEDEAAGQTGH